MIHNYPHKNDPSHTERGTPTTHNHVHTNDPTSEAHEVTPKTPNHQLFFFNDKVNIEI